MSTSGTTTFSRNRDQLIASALRKIGAFESGETPDSAAVNEASDALNVMIKHWQASGIEIWRTREAILFPSLGQIEYALGATSEDAAIGIDDYLDRELTVAAALGAGNLVLDSVDDVGSSDNIVIQLDDGTFQKTHLVSPPTDLSVPLAVALTDSAAVGNRVIIYATPLTRPLRIISARRSNLVSGIDIPLAEMDRLEYQDMPNKTSPGAVNSFYYDRRENTLGYMYLWPAPATLEESIKMTIAVPIQDFSAAGDDADLPQEWIRAVEWGLADELADEYDVPEPKRSRIERRAAQYLQEANWYERELVSIQFTPDNGR